MASVDTLADTLEAVEVETLGNQKGDVGGLDTAATLLWERQQHLLTHLVM